ncbi:MAG TPA: class II glutamine amidotransferase [Pseudobdellovibrionaceae bacterium]|nr:class II glutamine amidotransferase [Pseudobdellovibrionaceae bacterium]
MCQLLGMNCNVPTDICFSFTGFQARGGITDTHTDGWGISFFEDQGVRLFLDHQASARSPIAELVRQYPIKSKTVISHIRKATHGKVSLENTHPFQRELWGQYWVFAHNGHLSNRLPELTGPFQPVGTTDSESAFCVMLQALSERFGKQMPALEDLTSEIARLATHLGSGSEFNFLLSNGKALFAHCSTRLSYLVREAPFTTAALKDQNLKVNVKEVTTPHDVVAVIATQPITADEAWTTIEPGTLCVFAEGLLQARHTTVAGVPYQAGR